jgi:hypothetical protein
MLAEVNLPASLELQGSSISQMPEVQFAITHDDQWCDVLEAVGFSGITPGARAILTMTYVALQANRDSLDNKELYRQVREKYELVLQSGGCQVSILEMIYLRNGLFRLCESSEEKGELDNEH